MGKGKSASAAEGPIPSPSAEPPSHTVVRLQSLEAGERKSPNYTIPPDRETLSSQRKGHLNMLGSTLALEPLSERISGGDEH